jgi:hypothetical protein
VGRAGRSPPAPRGPTTANAVVSIRSGASVSPSSHAVRLWNGAAWRLVRREIPKALAERERIPHGRQRATRAVLRVTGRIYHPRAAFIAAGIRLSTTGQAPFQAFGAVCLRRCQAAAAFDSSMFAPTCSVIHAVRVLSPGQALPGAIGRAPTECGLDVTPRARGARTVSRTSRLFAHRGQQEPAPAGRRIGISRRAGHRAQHSTFGRPRTGGPDRHLGRSTACVAPTYRAL